jgi:hypothetical protein
MRRVTVSRLPLLCTAGGDGFVAQSILDLGLTIETVQAWLRVCDRIRSLCLDARLLRHWPAVVLYPTGCEAVLDQFHTRYQGQPVAASALRARGWAVFGAGHRLCAAAWRGRDRTVLHLHLLGGEFPLTYGLLHEVGHHHLYQTQGLPYQSHLDPEVERRIKGFTLRWGRVIGPAAAADDRASVVCALDILVRSSRKER